jgi:hypothetical protein
MKKDEPIFILSRYNEDVSWVKDYTDDYIVYNKGEKLPADIKSLPMENIGGNQRDIFYFIYNNYENLPDAMLFVQAFPFDHCNKEKFEKIMYNKFFTPLESYEHIEENGYQKKDTSGGFMERNNSWYIAAHNRTYKQSCRYDSFDQFMNSIFKNYKHLDWIRFAPGSQYIIEKRQALFYSKKFWSYLMDVINKKNTTEAHIIERSLMEIFKCYLEPIDELK